MRALSVSDAVKWLNGAVDALKSFSFQLLGSRPELKPMTSVLGLFGSGADAAALKNLPGTASVMSENVTDCAYAAGAASNAIPTANASACFDLIRPSPPD